MLCSFTLFLNALIALKVNSLQFFYNVQEKLIYDGYPFEIHHVTTKDGYILEMQRIPYSPKSEPSEGKPVIFMQHGLLASGDNFVFQDKNQALGYLAADSGYDVWLGNSRGTFYSRKNNFYEPTNNLFWNFSFTEIAIFDLPASIDYILDTTQQKNLHYVGHAQGTTVYLVLLSLLPEYHSKIKSGHLLAPISALRNAKSPIGAALGFLLGKSDPNREQKTSFEFIPHILALNKALAEACSQPGLISFCKSVLELYVGPTKVYTNDTLFSQLFATLPAGSSLNQYVHYAQLISSRKFQQFDWGKRINQQKYGTPYPPEYPIKNIRAPTFFYYSNGDYLSSNVDVEQLLRSLNRKAVAGTLFFDDGNWNHFDFLFANNLKSNLNLKIIKNLDQCEAE